MQHGSTQALGTPHCEEASLIGYQSKYCASQEMAHARADCDGWGCIPSATYPVQASLVNPNWQHSILQNKHAPVPLLIELVSA